MCTHICVCVWCRWSAWSAFPVWRLLSFGQVWSDVKVVVFTLFIFCLLYNLLMITFLHNSEYISVSSVGNLIIFLLPDSNYKSEGFGARKCYAAFFLKLIIKTTDFLIGSTIHCSSKFIKFLVTSSWREGGFVSYDYSWPLSSVPLIAWYWKFFLLRYTLVQVLCQSRLFKDDHAYLI
jgi:hypothetical protein